MIYIGLEQKCYYTQSRTWMWPLKPTRNFDHRQFKK